MKPGTKEKIEVIQQMSKDGHTVSEIAERLGMDAKSTRNLIRRQDICNVNGMHHIKNRPNPFDI